MRLNISSIPLYFIHFLFVAPLLWFVNIEFCFVKYKCESESTGIGSRLFGKFHFYNLHFFLVGESKIYKVLIYKVYHDMSDRIKICIKTIGFLNGLCLIGQ